MVPCPFGKMMDPVTTEQNKLSKNNWCDKNVPSTGWSTLGSHYEFSGHLYVLMRFEIRLLVFAFPITPILAIGTM